MQTKHRERREPWLDKWIRRCDSSPNLFQLRPPAQPFGNFPDKRSVYPVNFGLYPSHYAAARVGKLVRQVLVRGRTVWDALLELRAAGEVKRTISSTYVYPVGTHGWAVKALRRGEQVELPGPFRTPKEARLAVRRRISLAA